jgi:hypothetical protein
MKPTQQTRTNWNPATAPLLALLLAGGAGADDPAPKSDARTPLQQFTDETLDEFTLLGGPSLDDPLKIGARLRWDNNARGSESGLTAIYVGDGRAEAVLCVYPWAGRLVHDFGSLSRGRLVGRQRDETFWTPDQPGAVFREVPGADAPASSEAARLLQMKDLARTRFSATLVGWKADNSDRQALRLLPRPIYRYEHPAGDVFDGAVFGLVMGVDPEVIFLIEAVKTGSGARWEYGFVRRTSGELEARLDDNVVWTADRFPPTNNPQGLLRAVTRPLPADVLPVQEGATPE